MNHNHVTRDIKPLGQCPGCDEHHLSQERAKLFEVFKAGWMIGQGLTDEAMYEEDATLLQETFDDWLLRSLDDVEAFLNG